MRGNARSTTRLGALVASGALAISGLTLAVSPADAVPPPTPASYGADWLADELDGGAFDGAYSQGLSIDAALALVAVGGHSVAVNGVRTAMASRMTDYVSPQEYDYAVNPPTPTQIGHYANALAKATHFAQQVAADPTSYGGHDLVAELEARVTTTPGPKLGRIADDSSYGDYANTLGQAYAANALKTAGSTTLAGHVTGFLLKQQCSSGYFRQQFSDTGSATQSCVEGADKPDPDATAIAVQQLTPLVADPDVATAVAKAKQWLTSQQRCDGSFGGGAGTEGSNANSTGLAAWALGDSPAARQAAHWLKSLQIPQDAPPLLADDAGAIALDPTALASARANGITNASTRDQFRRATAQAVPGLRWYSADATPAIGLTGPTGFLKARSAATLTTTGAAQGTVLCLTGPGTSVRRIATGNPVGSRVTLPPGTATRSYRVTDPYGHTASRSLKVLGAKTLSVTTSRYRVKRTRSITAVIRGLAPGELARIYYKGQLVRSGLAGPKGNFLAGFRVGGAKGKKWVTGYGQFSDIRRGATTIKVVR